MDFYKPPTHHKLPLWSIKENRAFLEWELPGLASTSPWGDSSYSTHTLKQGTSKFYYVLNTKAFSFYIVSLFTQNCIGSLVRKREVISDFIDLAFIDILILFLLSFSCSIRMTHIPSYRSFPVPLIPFATLYFNLSNFYLYYTPRYTGPRLWSSVTVMFLDILNIFLFFGMSNILLPFSTADHWGSAHRHSLIHSNNKCCSSGSSLYHLYIFISLLLRCVSLYELLYHQWFHLLSSQSYSIPRSLHDTSLLLLFL